MEETVPKVIPPWEKRPAETTEEILGKILETMQKQTDILEKIRKQLNETELLLRKKL